MVWCGALTGGNGNEGPTDLDGEGISFFNFEVLSMHVKISLILI